MDTKRDPDWKLETALAEAFMARAFSESPDVFTAADVRAAVAILEQNDGVWMDGYYRFDVGSGPIREPSYVLRSSDPGRA